MAITFPTNADTDLYDYQIGTGTTLTFDVPLTYYFDASDAGPTDVGGSWNNEAFAFDGDPDTLAQDLLDSGVLKGTGTNAPASGPAITSVSAANKGNPSWVELSVPSGGWTWAKIQALHLEYDSLNDNVKVYESDGGTLLGTPWTLPIQNAHVVSIAVNVTDRHYLIMALGDDNVETWATPTDFTQWFQENNADYDDASVGAWYALAEDVVSSTVDLVRSASEEQCAVMIVVQGADQTTFIDTAYVKADHFYAQDETDTPDPKAIDTTTDNAVVICLTGQRNDAGHLVIDAFGNWDVDPPSGYTIESEADGPTNTGTQAEAAPGRIEQGTGSGDVALTWAHKTITPDGTENPGAFANFTDTRDHKTVTFAIRPAAGGTPATVTPSVIGVTLTAPTPTPKTGVKVTAGVVPVTTGVDQVAAGISAAATPGIIGIPLTAPTPTPTAGTTVTPSTTPIPLTAPAPTPKASTTTTPGVIPIPLTAPSPGIVIHETQTPGVIPIPITAPAPTPTAGVKATPGVIPIPLTAPTPTPTAGVTVTPGVISFPLTATAPTPTAGVTVTPGVLPLTLTADQVTAIGGGGAGATVTPSVIGIILTAPTPTPLAGVTVTPGEVGIQVTVPQSTPTAGTVTTPGVIDLPLTAPAPTPTAGVTVEAGVIQIPVTLPTPTPTAGVLITADTVAIPFTTGATGITAGTAVTPTVIPFTLSVPQPTGKAGVTVTPGVIPVPLTADQVTAIAGGDSTVTPTVIGIPLTAPTPTSKAGVTVTPGVLGVQVAAPQPTPTTGVKATLGTIGIPLTAGQVTVTAGTSVILDGLAVILTAPQPTAAASIVVTPGRVLLVVTEGTVNIIAQAPTTPTYGQIAHLARRWGR